VLCSQQHNLLCRATAAATAAAAAAAAAAADESYSDAAATLPSRNAALHVVRVTDNTVTATAGE
jgi:hypothetical protein